MIYVTMCVVWTWCVVWTCLTYILYPSILDYPYFVLHTSTVATLNISWLWGLRRLFEVQSLVFHASMRLNDCPALPLWRFSFLPLSTR